MLSKIFAIYKTSTGEITRKLTVPEDYPDAIVDDNLDPLTEDSLEVVDDFEKSEWYVSGGVMTARPVQTATWDTLTISANGIDDATLGSSLVNPTTITFTVLPSAIGRVDDYVETSGSFSFTTTISGDYTIVAKSFPYQDLVAIITAS